jgi:hypothetical protein
VKQKEGERQMRKGYVKENTFVQREREREREEEEREKKGEQDREKVHRDT